MKELSLFVDESGDFGLEDLHSPYYIVSIVFHDQSEDLSPLLHTLNHSLANLGYQDNAVHTAPLIRKESPYQNYLPSERRAIFTKLFYFTIKSNIKFKSFLFYKKNYSDSVSLENKMKKEISQFVKNNLAFFQSFEHIILYYDNGQQALSRILEAVLSSELAGYEIRKAMPKDYRLSQVADLICTLKLLEQKRRDGIALSRSEKLIFHSEKELKRDFLKALNKKSFD